MSHILQSTSSAAAGDVWCPGNNHPDISLDIQVHMKLALLSSPAKAAYAWQHEGRLCWDFSLGSSLKVLQHALAGLLQRGHGPVLHPAAPMHPRGAPKSLSHAHSKQGGLPPSYFGLILARIASFADAYYRDLLFWCASRLLSSAPFRQHGEGSTILAAIAIACILCTGRVYRQCLDTHLHQGEHCRQNAHGPFACLLSLPAPCAPPDMCFSSSTMLVTARAPALHAAWCMLDSHLHTAHCTLHTAYCISSSLAAILQCVHESRPKQSSPTAWLAGTARLALGLLCAWQVIANLIHQRLGSIQRGKQGELCSMHPR